MLILSHTSHNYFIKTTNKSINTQQAYIGLEPKSSHTIKYSQPLDLVLFQVTLNNIKWHKGSSYPHLLIN